MATKIPTDSREHGIEKLREMMKDIKFCMMTTVDEDGSLRSRPMTLQQAEFDGDLWFLNGKSTSKTSEIRRDYHVNLSFSDPDENKFVSISGLARIVNDRKKVEELWNVFYRAWFPKGVDDPEISLIKVEVTKAEYWDMPNSTMVELFGAAKAMLTGKSPEIGEHEKLNLVSN